MLAGGLGGAAIGLPITSAIQGMPTETKAQLLAALVGTGMIGGGLAGIPIGGYAGYRAGRWATGESPWEQERAAKEKAEKA